MMPPPRGGFLKLREFSATCVMGVSDVNTKLFLLHGNYKEGSVLGEN